MNELSIEDDNNLCNICFEISENVKKSPCVCKTIKVCDKCLSKMQNDSMICTVCKTRFEMNFRITKIIKNIILVILKLITLIVLILGPIFIVGAIIYSISYGDWPKIIPEILGNIFLIGLLSVALIAVVIVFCKVICN